MAFGGNGRVGHAAGSGDLAEAAKAIERTIPHMARVRQRLDAAGAPLAATYAEGACDAMSFALEAVLRSIAKLGAAGEVEGAWVGTTRLRLLPEASGVYGALTDAAAVAPPSDAGPSLGADLSASPEIVARLRGDEVASALMCATLAHFDWLHLASDAVFVGDALAARAVVSTVAGRTSFPDLTRLQLGGLVHRESADALGALGWRRMTGAPLPSA